MTRFAIETPNAPLAEWVLKMAGLDASAYRRESLLRRVPACLRHLRTTCPATARELLQRKPQLIDGALNSVLIGVTEFFRDEAVFQPLRTVVLPELLRTRERIRVYSAGVSTGEELYSVAMLLAEAGALERSELLGLDCRPAAIAQAQSGAYGPDQIGRLDPQLRAKYFRRREAHWIADMALRSRMDWKLGNLFAFRETTGRDLILFRNVAIYLDPTHAADAWSQLCGHLTTGGFLVAGRAEQPINSLPLRRITSSIYQRI